ncbi:hypothetical protein [Curtobacterium sp. ISL-83]|uniref:hypothetical protein n=1 Tax=Curtobacterium sp. ISL-83 TaxID=2819145 RepID=UPI001BE7D17A|nr:hypothetical protein [Curtobacterium sp. ISL-83]MBT2502976.1 hypothetical protein [Curtobacterium sp. ISL-83]
MTDQEQRSTRGADDLRATGLVALVIGVLLVLVGGAYPALGVIGWVLTIGGVVCLIAWLAVRAARS